MLARTLPAATSIMPLTIRTRRSPFFESSNAAGAKSYISYNHTLLAGDFVDPESDYRHLKRAVQLWDVGCERQVEIIGPDARRLVQMATPRDLSRMRDDQCFYAPTVDRDGLMTNDPVVLRVGEDRYWVSIADSDLLLYFKGLAAGLGLDVHVHEPDVSPLAIQGPKAATLVERLWGEAAAKLGFFRHMRVDVDGHSMVLARSGYSLQGGFELYFERDAGGAPHAGALWDRLMEAGRDLDVQAGSPCQAERIEGGLYSFLSDITFDMTPFEAGLGRFCALDRDVGCLGYRALCEKAQPTRQLRPIQIDGGRVPPMTGFWTLRDDDRNAVGRVSSCAYAYSFERNIGIALVDASHWAPGTELAIDAADGPRTGRVLEGFPGRT